MDDNKLLEVNIEGRIFKGMINEETGVLKVLKEPEDDEILRFKSVKINEDDLLLVVKFMTNKLLPTMRLLKYKELSHKKGKNLIYCTKQKIIYV